MTKRNWMGAALAAGAVLAAGPTAAAGLDFSGTWHVSGTIMSGDRVVFSATPTCIFQQAGSTLTGTCKGPNALGPAAGRVDGANIAWQADMKAYTAIGASGVISCAGTVGPDGVIRGRMRYAGLPGLVGAFTAQR